MALTPAEITFAHMHRAKRNRNVLRESLVRMRAKTDTGLQELLMDSQDARRRHAHAQRAELAAHRGAGSVIGQASAAELLHDVPLPPCDRWGDFVSRGYASMQCALATHEALANRWRPTLPHAAMVASGARVGPHGTIDAQLRLVSIRAVSYHSIANELVAVERGARPMSHGVAAHANVTLEPADEDGQDESAAQQDGARVWPPEALGDGARARAMAEAVDTLNAYLTEHVSKDDPQPGLGTAGVDLYRRGCSKAAGALAGKAVADFRELGLCAFTKEPQLLVELNRRALLLAMTAQAQTGADEVSEALAQALVKLSGLMVRCA